MKRSSAFRAKSPLSLQRLLYLLHLNRIFFPNHQFYQGSRALSRRAEVVHPSEMQGFKLLSPILILSFFLMMMSSLLQAILRHILRALSLI